MDSTLEISINGIEHSARALGGGTASLMHPPRVPIERPAACSRPRSGYNHNIRYKDRLFHVQTEDSGSAKGHIYSHVFCNGIVVSTNKVIYDAREHRCGASRHIVGLMKESHKSMARRLCGGLLDGAITRLLGADPAKGPLALGPRTAPRRAPPEAPAEFDAKTQRSRDPSPDARSSPDDRDLATQRRLIALKETIDMTNMMDGLKRIQTDTPGTLGVALVDYESGMCLGALGTGIDLEIAAAGNMEVMKAKMAVMRELGIDGGIEDILITLKDQYHIIRPMGTSMFLYLALDRTQGNLALARRRMGSVAEEIQV